MSKKNNSKQDRMRLAQAISEIMTNPQTPVGLFNAVAEETNEWSQALLESAESNADHIAACLNAYYEREEKRTKGGAR